MWISFESRCYIGWRDFFIISSLQINKICQHNISDFERGIKGVSAVVGAFSLGTSYVAMKGAGFATQEILMNKGKAVAIDAASTTTSYWTGYACNEMGLLLPLTLILSMGAGIGTSPNKGDNMIKDFIKEKDIKDDVIAKYQGIVGEDVVKMWKE